MGVIIPVWTMAELPAAVNFSSKWLTDRLLLSFIDRFYPPLI
jgi:hypothetical protein